jgi:CheY-like chemotaxis protein
LGYTDIALSRLKRSDPLYKDLKHVMGGANRAKDLVQQILTFSRQIEQEYRPLKLHLMVKEVIKLLRPSIPSTIEIRERIDTSCDKVLADPSQIHQVLVNLCTNGFHAMEKSGGVLTIELKQVKVDGLTVQFYPNLEEKEYVRLTVSDTGMGMDDETLDRIFEPFYTTKDIDKGTGLGLSVVHGIVRSHHGDIVVYSEPGKGSTFHVYLPVQKTEVKTSEEKEQKIQGGDETILVVDDEEIVTDVLQKMLKQIGYQVSVRNSSIEALKIFHQQVKKYDLIISDLTMPNMTGLELAKEVHQVRGDLPIVIMTGYGENITGDIVKHYGISKIMGKPIEMEKLALVIRQILDKK